MGLLWLKHLVQTRIAGNDQISSRPLCSSAVEDRCALEPARIHPSMHDPLHSHGRISALLSLRTAEAAAMQMAVLLMGEGGRR